jgi:DNA-binding LytR/AlgR family response regulator
VSESTLTVLAVDDEEPQLADLARLLHESPHVDDVDTALTPQEAMEMARARRYDAVFLDVRMPRVNGLDFARVLNAFAFPPVIVFVSAFEISAATAFRLRAVDYIMKPVVPERIDDALRRIAVVARAPTNTSEARSPAPAEGAAIVTDERMVVSNRRGSSRIIPRESIVYLSAYGDYIRVFADTGRYLVRGPLSEAEKRFAPYGFIRVHRKYLANLDRAVELLRQRNGTAYLRLSDGAEIPVARRHLAELRRRLRP